MLFAPIHVKLETRALADGAVAISGVFPYASPTVIARRADRELREQFAPGAFHFEDVELLAQHDFKQPLANTGGGSLTLRNSDAGLAFEARIDPEVAAVSYAKDALALIHAGLARGLSPGFVVSDEEVLEDGAAITRTIRKAELVELSIVTRAAYPQAQVEARSWIAANNPYVLMAKPPRCYRGLLP